MREVIDPPFSNRRQALAFSLLIIILLLLPVILTRSGLLTRKELYSTVPTKAGAFPYIQREVFEGQSDIDILVLGTSLLWAAIDTPYLQRELSKTLDKEATVITLGSNWRGEDLNYTLLRDVLQRRKVKMLVFSMPAYYQVMNGPHNQSSHWFLFGDDPRADELPVYQRLALYGESVLGGPRHLLSKVRRDKAAAAEEAAVLGALIVENGFNGAPFVKRELKPPLLVPESLIYSDANSEKFHFTGQALNSYQMHFLNQAFQLLREHNVRIALVHVPLSSERHKQVVEERMYWPDVFGMKMAIVGVAPSILFQGLPDTDIDQFYYDEHLNANGNKLFTKTITPALIKIYAANEQSAE